MATIVLLVSTLAINILYWRYTNIQSVICSLIPLTMAIYTYFGCILFNYGYVIPFSLFNSHDNIAIIFSINYFAVVSLSLIFGGYISSFFIKRDNLDKKLLFNDLLLNNTQKICNFFSIMPLFVSIINYDVSDFLYRDFYYMDGRFSIVSQLLQILFPIGAAAAALGKSSFAKFGFISGVIILFSLNSRGVILYILVYTVIKTINQRDYKPWVFVLGVFSTLVFTATSFLLRERAPQGLVGNMESLGASGFVEFSDSLISGFNYLFSYPLATFLTTDTMAKGDYDLFFASVTPLPSIIYNVDYVINTGRINEFSPFSAAGQIFTFLGLWSLIFWVLYGIIINYFINGIFKSALFSSFMMGLFVLITILATTYNLRGVTRLIYIAPLFALTMRMVELKIIDHLGLRINKQND